MSVQSPSSSTENLSKCHDEHSREEVADNAFLSIKPIHLDEYFEYLNKRAQNKIHFAKINRLWMQIKKETFIDCANEISRHIYDTKRNTNTPDTGGTFYCPKHVTNTQCRPDIVAAFKNDWHHHHSQVYAWPQIQLTGEIISEGKNIDTQRRQAASHLYYMILARPDLYVAHGLLLDDLGVTFFAGITGHGIFCIRLEFDDDRLRPLLYALVHHIYNPGEFKDNRVGMQFNWQLQGSEYTLRLQMSSGLSLPCNKFRAIYAGNPFETTTYAYARSQRPILPCDAIQVNEPEILKHIHEERDIPGVVKLLHDEEWETLVPSNRIVKRRLGLSQQRSTFMSIRTVKAMLEAAYDILEVTRYLRFKRNVLHRDLSVGNIVVNTTSDASDTPLSKGGTESNQDRHTKELEICFIKHLLGESSNPGQTSTVLINFNRAERLDINTGTTHARIGRTGTPLFIARAVQNGGPFPDLPQSPITVLVGVPEPSPTYQQCHPERTQLFDKIRMGFLLDEDAILTPREWRRELYHDAESILWVIFYWSILANPEPRNIDQKIDTANWLRFINTSSCVSRDALMFCLAGGLKEMPLHSKFSPALMLLRILAQAVYPGPYYLTEDNPRTRPDFVHEVFQRAILNFIIKHKDEDFINLEIDSKFRRLDIRIPRPPSNFNQASSTTSSKRPSPVPEHEQDDNETTSAKGVRISA
ncbi:hypothetical protein CVT25_008358 [Psilocybe cyanescens]|uniref:Fungal-type protein kinase domain-containing protein n=1 Tax=Psilocybe cyanescens TaxID=93625 RepID=A0A409WV83_PSICY|nr:hypothetical protein CVT25_008358 [Psilocybe cyanescens]